jgi:hypothetical protein
MSVGGKLGKNIWLTLSDPGATATGDDQAVAAFPFTRGVIQSAVMTLETTGTSSSTTSYMISKARAGTKTDMLSAVASIAYNASSEYLRIAKGDFSDTDLKFGDQVQLDCDSIAGGTAAQNGCIVIKVKVLY